MHPKENLMLKIIAIGTGVVLAALLVFAATRPDTFRVERSVLVKAPPEKIFSLLNDFHNWTAWSPYEKIDPSMKRSYGGPVSGQGSNYGWEGRGKAGAGRMVIMESAPGSKISIQLDFSKPFESRNIAEFTLLPQGQATQVTWAMHGPSPFIAKLMGVIFNMDRMIGKDFEIGLENLKTIAEK